MRIAYISWEMPPDTGSGGIGTYIAQISKIMAERGHDIHVFCGTNGSSRSEILDGVTIHRISGDRMLFSENVLPFFDKLHKLIPFDLIESQEYKAEGYHVRLKFPDIPHIVKCHTPTFFVSKLNNISDNWFKRVRFMVMGALRLKRVKPYWKYDYKTDIEYQYTKMATTITSPSRAMAEVIEKEWRIETGAIEVVNNPFQPSSSFLEIKPVDISGKIHVLFLGKLEIRKGILNFGESIPIVLERFPETIFIFAGEPLPSPFPKILMDEYLILKLQKYRKNLRFMGKVDYSRIPSILEKSEICVFPSLWENFPNVCLEAMVAGRAVIGSNSGGMAEMIDPENNGLLVPPNDSAKIAELIIELLSNPQLIEKFGEEAKKSILQRFNKVSIGEETEKVYNNSIFGKI